MPDGPDLLDQLSSDLNKNFMIVRYGKVCHHNGNVNQKKHVWSVSKSIGALALGVLAQQTKDLKSEGKMTGPFNSFDNVSKWMKGSYGRVNRDSKIVHILGMIAHNKDLSKSQKNNLITTTSGFFN